MSTGLQTSSRGPTILRSSDYKQGKLSMRLLPNGNGTEIVVPLDLSQFAIWFTILRHQCTCNTFTRPECPSITCLFSSLLGRHPSKIDITYKLQHNEKGITS
jgi:hypothetical protein